jgi:hypothetical protein
MLELKKLPAAAIPAALAKAERYRLLNEPFEAESICQDILATEPTHSGAMVTLILSLSDQFSQSGAQGVQEAQAIVPRLPNEYDRSYYAGIVCERWAKSQLGLKPVHTVYHWLREALAHFERAAQLAPPDNADSLLRWNSTVRLLNAHPEMGPKSSDEPGGEGYGWDEPPSGRK